MQQEPNELRNATYCRNNSINVVPAQHSKL